MTEDWTEPKILYGGPLHVKGKDGLPKMAQEAEDVEVDDQYV